jgi:hypothetical protein
VKFEFEKVRNLTAGRAESPARPSEVEPSTFAWTEPLADLDPIVLEKQVLVEKIVEKKVIVEKLVEAPNKKDKVVIIGRGPSIGERLVRTAPNLNAVMAGAAALLIALAGVALVSPSGDQANAARAINAIGQAASATGSTSIGSGTDEVKPIDSSETPAAPADRDPFAAQGFRPKTKAKSKKASDKKTDKKATPASASASLFTADFIAYSSYTPWTTVSRRSGTWIEFDGKPTVKVVSVTENTADLFVVSDVDVLSDKSRDMTYSYPLRTVHVEAGGVVRFADYRDIQGEDVVYTIRFKDTHKIDLGKK